MLWLLTYKLSFGVLTHDCLIDWNREKRIFYMAFKYCCTIAAQLRCSHLNTLAAGHYASLQGDAHVLTCGIVHMVIHSSVLRISQLRYCNDSVFRL